MHHVMTSMSWRNPLDEYSAADLKSPGATYCSTTYSIEVELTAEVQDDSPYFAVGVLRDFRLKQNVPAGCSVDIVARHVFCAEASKDHMLPEGSVLRNLLKFVDDVLTPCPANPGYTIFIPVKEGESLDKIRKRINRAIYKRQLATQLNNPAPAE